LKRFLSRGLLFSCLFPALGGVAFGQAQNYLRNNSFVNWESPQVHPLDITPDGTKLLAVNTANNTLEIYNVTSSMAPPAFVRSVPVGLDPVTVRARTNTQAWVVNVISDSVSIVDLTNGIVTQTLQTEDEPADVVFAGSGQTSAFVSCAQAKTVLVFNAASPSSVQQTILINGEQPRALATSANGRYVYLAIFESGNATTILPGGVNNQFEHSVVDDTTGPYNGANPPPNSGTTFSPAVNPSNPTPIPVSLIVRKSISGTLARWLDDNNHDWSAFITGNKAQAGTPGDRVAGWDLPDRDVAIIDTGSNYAVTYQSSLMNMVMSIAVNPANGNVTLVGTDATNQIRYEPVVQSTFVHVEGASFTPGGANTIFDLNPQITYQTRSVAMAQRQLSIGDPRAIAWNSNGTTAYVAGMGSNNVIVMGPAGTRQGLINVGQGPTGIVLDQTNGRAFVLNRFDATISTVNTSTATQAFVTPLQYDPTPLSIKLGRPLLYDTHLNSGLGQISCASCHVVGAPTVLPGILGIQLGR
jgi:DNA-binding beta-propeller fold protein YncE